MSDATTASKGGAPVGNRNRMLSGLRAVRGWQTIGSLPKGASYVRRTLGRMRTELENAVREAHGEISQYHAAVILSACRHEARAMLAARWLRLEGNEASLTDRLALLATITSASDARDKCLEKLGLNVKPDSNPWRILDEPRAPAATSHDATPLDESLGHIRAERSSVAPASFNGKTHPGLNGGTGDAAGQSPSTGDLMAGYKGGHFERPDNEQPNADDGGEGQP